MEAVLTRPEGYLVDLDGTLYAGGAAIPGAVSTLARLRQQNIPVRLVTNTTSRSRTMLVERLQGYGFRISPEEVFTPTRAGGALALRAGHRRVAPFMPESALEDLADLELAGGTCNRPAQEVPEAVIVGDLGESWTYSLLQEAFHYLIAGATLIALSKDRYWLNQERLVLDAGPFVAALEFATGKSAIVAGKPSFAFYTAAVQSLGLDP